jgi:hypothetical protein
MMDNIPAALKSRKQWINYHSATDKRPIPSDYTNPDNHLTFDQAYAKKPEVGFVPKIDDEIVLLDFDECQNLKHVPPGLRDWISENKPYVEKSPSGNGFRLVATVPVEVKQKVKAAYKKAKAFKGQIGFHTNYQTITGNNIPSYENLVDLPFDIICAAFNMNSEAAEPDQDVCNIDWTNATLPSLEQIMSYLELIPIDGGDKIQRVYGIVFKEAYEHYNFWMYIGMALYDWGDKSGQLPIAFQTYDTWSAKDERAYVGTEDVLSHWKSFSTTRDDRVTYRTLVLLASHFKLEWPIPKKSDNTKAPPQPAVLEHKNFEYLFNDFLWLKVITDSMKSQEYYLTGNSKICEAYLSGFGIPRIGDLFGPIPLNVMHAFTYKVCQDHQYRQLGNNINQANTNRWLLEPHSSTNMIRYWLDTPDHELPEELQHNIGDQSSTLRDLFDCIEFRRDIKDKDLEFYYTVFKKAFLGWLKLYYYRGPYALNNLIPILSGPENSRKSTFINNLLPPVLASKYITGMNYDLKSISSVRDANRLTAGHAFLEWGEIDRFLSDDVSSTFKDFVSADKFTVTDKYDKHESVFKKHALLIGTTNSTDLVLSREGTRRTPILPISHIDTAKMTSLNLHRIYTHLRDTEYFPALKSRRPDDPMPWILTEDEITIVEVKNIEYRAETNLAIALQEVFDFSAAFPGLNIPSVQTDTTGRVMKITQVKSILERTHRLNVSLPHLKRELKMLCGQWTGTFKNMSIDSAYPIFQGQTWTGEGRSKKTYWVMPPLVQSDVMD